MASDADDNVPPWHTREAVSVLREWNPDADVTYVFMLVFGTRQPLIILKVPRAAWPVSLVVRGAQKYSCPGVS
jgi:hypothetical protein